MAFPFHNFLFYPPSFLLSPHLDNQTHPVINQGEEAPLSCCYDWGELFIFLSCIPIGKGNNH
jgi:hypothetical protein